MPRDTEGIILTKFAATGDSESPESLASPRTFQYAEGFPSSYSGPGGNKVPRTVINYLYRTATAAIADLNKMGVFQWHASINYTANQSCVLSANGLLCIAVTNSGPATTAVDPDTDTTESTWFRLAGPATTTRAGLVRGATNAESDAGSSVNAYMTPSQVASRISTFQGTYAGPWISASVDPGWGSLNLMYRTIGFGSSLQWRGAIVKSLGTPTNRTTALVLPENIRPSTIISMGRVYNRFLPTTTFQGYLEFSTNGNVSIRNENQDGGIPEENAMRFDGVVTHIT